MSQTPTKRVPADRKKKAAKKAVAKKTPGKKVVASPPDDVTKKDVTQMVAVPVTIKGKPYQIRATKYLVLKLMKGSAVITDWAEDRDEDDEIAPHEVMELAENYETLIKLFDARDGFTNGKVVRKSSRERIMDALDDGEIDFDDFQGVFKQMSAVRENAGSRPLG